MDHIATIYQVRVVIYFKDRIIQELIIPVGNQTLSYAELFAVYFFLIWLRNDYAVPRTNNSSKVPVHIFTDSMYTQTTLCDTFIPKKHFSLVEDLKNITSFLADDFDFFIHWIPSHIENTSVGKLPISGNAKADNLARLALEQKEPLHKDMSLVRKEILVQSAQLITDIEQLLANNPHICTTGGPSDLSDDFSHTDAIRNTSFRVP
jgi:ribonuclease HI